MKTEHWSSRAAAERYARGRPYYQDQVIQRVRGFLKIQGQVPRALDVGCGTGLSSIALKEIARRIAACDVAHDMVSVATPDPQIDYLTAGAEALPFSSACFDLVTASSAFHWFDFRRFEGEVIRVLRPGGWAVLYDHHFTAQAREIPDFQRWHIEVYARRYPLPPRHAPPELEEFQSEELSVLGRETYKHTVSFSRDRLTDNYLTHSNVTAALESGKDTTDGVIDWLRQQWAQFTALEPDSSTGGTAEFLYRAQIFYLQRTEY